MLFMLLHVIIYIRGLIRIIQCISFFGFVPPSFDVFLVIVVAHNKSFSTGLHCLMRSIAPGKFLFRHCLYELHWRFLVAPGPESRRRNRLLRQLHHHHHHLLLLHFLRNSPLLHRQYRSPIHSRRLQSLLYLVSQYCPLNPQHRH